MNTPLEVALLARKDAIVANAVLRERIAKNDARIRRLDREIATLGGPPQPRRNVIGLRVRAQRGELSRAMYDLLRHTERATANDLARVIAKANGISFADSAIMDTLRESCLEAFKRAERKRLVRRIATKARADNGRSALWTLAVHNGR
jgi:hypothetical protein